ncbi:MAG TPA: hypothetical protein VFH43_11395 [Candidatus Kapabacteria bacterium]|nr:hypothetical protein [Candidatus Kapabacteria bacterium]
MSVHDEILGFLDGNLSAEAEAELLHRMSVSPERRALLRSYFQQQSMFAQDRQSINVPFEAEQGLWARLDSLMPAVPAAIPVAQVASMTAATSAGFFSKFSMAGSALVASLLLMLGFGGGYLAGNTADNSAQSGSLASNAQSSTTQASTTHASAPQIIYRDAEPQIIENERIVTRYITRYIHVPAASTPGAAIAMSDVVENNASDMSRNSLTEVTTSAEPEISLAQPVVGQESRINVGGEGLKPVFPSVASTREEVIEKSVLERFEFSFNESFGRQFPNNEATNTSVPLITNSSVSIYFQVLPRSEKLWAGFSVGTANVTRKQLGKDPINELGDEYIVKGDYTHVPTNWLGGFLQYRVPMSRDWDFTATGGYGFASAGNMLIGEVGTHVDVTKDVGFTVGLRGTRLSYDLKGEMQELIDNSEGSLSIPRGVTDATPSFNLEVATGLFFHF